MTVWNVIHVLSQNTFALFFTHILWRVLRTIIEIHHLATEAHLICYYHFYSAAEYWRGLCRGLLQLLTYNAPDVSLTWSKPGLSGKWKGLNLINKILELLKSVKYLEMILDSKLPSREFRTEKNTQRALSELWAYIFRFTYHGNEINVDVWSS